MLSRLMSKPWVVYCKTALEYKAVQVNYLAGYTHRIGLSNSRLTAVRAGRIGVAWKDYRRAPANDVVKAGGAGAPVYSMYSLKASCVSGITDIWRTPLKVDVRPRFVPSYQTPRMSWRKRR